MMEKENEKKTARGGSQTMFPGRLHELLEYVESQGLDYIVSWVRDGTAFMVHNQVELLKLLSFFFGQSKYRSFTRQLNMWCFQREEVGPFKGSFSHPHFLKHDKSLCAKMRRHEPKSRGTGPTQSKKTKEIHKLLDSYIRPNEENISWSSSTSSTHVSERHHDRHIEPNSLSMDLEVSHLLREVAMSSSVVDEEIEQFSRPLNAHVTCHPDEYFPERVVPGEMSWITDHIPLSSTSDPLNLDGSLFHLESVDELEPTPIVELAQQSMTCWGGIGGVSASTAREDRKMPHMTIPHFTGWVNTQPFGSIIEALGSDDDALYVLKLLQTGK